MSDNNRRLKSYCNECLQHTNHDLIAERKREWPEFDEHGQPRYVERIGYEFVQCRGCENVSLRRTWSCSARPEEETDYFPPAVCRKQPSWLSVCEFLFGTKGEIYELFREVYSALFSGNNRLALMGTRAIVDMALTDKLGDVGDFSQKLKEARKNGWITDIHYNTLNTAIDAGNAASHRGYKPETKDLELVLDIVEHLIQLLYVFEPSAKKIAKQTPPRPPRLSGRAPRSE